LGSKEKKQLQNTELKRPLPKVGWTEDDTKWEIPRRTAYESS
jgi:hypothetical protein